LIPRLVIATKNAGKREEMTAILEEMGVVDEVVTGLDWPDVEEVGETLEQNALLKARAVVESTGLPALADDTGLEVDALGGAPGVHTARYAGPEATYDDNNRKLLQELEGVANRRARFVTVVALVFPDGEYVTAEGSVEGRIAEEPRGERGFGYDPVFEIDGRTYAEMSLEEKNRFSHRARALTALGKALGL
jgi:XTP/dITP diphosphohydrolase